MGGEADGRRMDELRPIGVELRRARARVRAGLQAGTTSLAEVLSPVHPAVADLSLAEVVRMTRAHSARGGMEALGREAVSRRVNLMLRAGRASAASRAWVAAEGEKWQADAEDRRRRRAAA